MVEGSITSEFFGFNTQMELNQATVSVHSGSMFVEECQNFLIPNTNNPFTDEPDTQNELCEAVLKYINQVLMEDDFENEIATAASSTLDATKRIFHDILDASNNESYAPYKNKKCLVDNLGEHVLREMFGKIVLLKGISEEPTSDFYDPSPHKGLSRRKAIDMRTLLLQCTEFVGSSDYVNATKLLKEIRSRACIYGDGTQRLAHYFADGLESRLVADDVPQYRTLPMKTLTDFVLLKALKLYIRHFPFTETSYFFANEVILQEAEKATTLHIIHFGIMHGLQWPPFIERLSKRPGGPPKLRITAIDFPQAGFRPDSRVKETGRQLSNYCREHKVPFEYNFISKKWDAVKLEELRLNKSEIVAINCMYHLQYLIDDTVMEQSPRDVVLNLMRSINPAIFVHVVTNGDYSTPYFISRSREVLFHYLTWFEMFDAVFPRESTERMVFERDVFGNELLNVIACEGLHRTARPETIKQWGKRTKRAGFKPIPLNQTIVNAIRTRIKLAYHKDFFVDEAGPWLLDGWRGRSVFGLSCWKPAKLGWDHILEN